MIFKESEALIGDDFPAAGQRREQLRQGVGKQPGDPARAAEAIIAAIVVDDPPLRLLLGKRALDTVYRKLDAMRADFDLWRTAALP
jgi:hypothetical protein